LGDLEQILGDIENEACRAGDVIDRIRGSLRRQKPSAETLDINAVVMDAVRLVSDDTSARGMDVVTHLSGDRPQAAGDRTQIVQVLINLIMNGTEAMEAVQATQRRLSLYTAREHGEVVISVRDCGRGIKPEDMEQLFDPFFTTRREGMGLGLSIARSIVLAHGGRIWAENNVEGGATFHFSLPA
jgi:signal transduction histidine kinase